MSDLELNALLARGGWVVADPRPTAAQHPDTFELPNEADLAGLGPGSVVRARFDLVTIADVSRDEVSPYDDEGRPVLVVHGERMWAVVTEVADGIADCILENQPVATHTHLRVFDRLQIPLSHLIATRSPLDDYADFLEFATSWDPDVDGLRTAPTDPVDPLAPPRITPKQQAVCDRAGVRAEPPNIFGVTLLARNVTPESTMVRGARFEPVVERGDCGWIFFADSSDFEAVARDIGFTRVPLQQALQAHPAIDPYVALPVGYGFTIGAGGFEDLYEVNLED